MNASRLTHNHALVTGAGGLLSDLPVGARFIQGDLWDHHLVDYIYYLAAYAAEGLSHFIRHKNYVTNIVASINTINAALSHAVSFFIFTSSIAIYGSLGHRCTMRCAHSRSILMVLPSMQWSSTWRRLTESAARTTSFCGSTMSMATAFRPGPSPMWTTSGRLLHRA